MRKMIIDFDYDQDVYSEHPYLIGSEGGWNFIFNALSRFQIIFKRFKGSYDPS